MFSRLVPAHGSILCKREVAVCMSHTLLLLMLLTLTTATCSYASVEKEEMPSDCDTFMYVLGTRDGKRFIFTQKKPHVDSNHPSFRFGYVLGYLIDGPSYPIYPPNHDLKHLLEKVRAAFSVENNVGMLSIGYTNMYKQHIDGLGVLKTRYGNFECGGARNNGSIYFSYTQPGQANFLWFLGYQKNVNAKPKGERVHLAVQSPHRGSSEKPRVFRIGLGWERCSSTEEHYFDGSIKLHYPLSPKMLHSKQEVWFEIRACKHFNKDGKPPTTRYRYLELQASHKSVMIGKKGRPQLIVTPSWTCFLDSTKAIGGGLNFECAYVNSSDPSSKKQEELLRAEEA